MKKRIWRLLAIFACSMTTLHAQSPVPEGQAILIPSSEVQAKIEDMVTAGGQDEPLRVLDIAGESNLGVFVIRLSPRESQGSVTLMTHDDIAEVYYVLEGEGIIYHGGDIQDPTARSTRVAGPGTGGTGTDYMDQRVGPGDMFIVRPNTPHQVNIGALTEMVYLVVRVDPEKHLELH